MKPNVLLVGSFIPASQTANVGSVLCFEARGSLLEFCSPPPLSIGGGQDGTMFRERAVVCEERPGMTSMGHQRTR